MTRIIDSSRGSKTIFALLLSTAGLFGADVVSAAAPSAEKAACMSAYTQAQSLRRDHKLKASKEQLIICARKVCPAALQRDCTQWFSELEQVLPSVQFEVKGLDGSEMVDVRVFVDDKKALDALDGAPFTLDPGMHTFRFEIEGAEAIEQKVVIREGEQSRKIQVSFQPAKPAAPEPKPETKPVEKPKERPVPTASYIFGGLGVVGLGVFAVSGGMGLSKKSDLDSCKGSCAQSDVDAAKSKFLVADIGLGVGLLSLGAATYFYLTRPEQEVEAPTETGIRFNVLPVAGGGAAAQVGGSF